MGKLKKQSSAKNKVQQESEPPLPQKESSPVQKEEKSAPGPEKGLRIGKAAAIVATTVSICIALIACLAALAVIPEVRNLLGLKDEPNQVEVIIPTEVISPTPTNGPCVDVIDVRFISDTIFTKERLSELYPAPPKGQYMILATEYKNMQSQAIHFYWDEDFKVAGQFNTSTSEFTYYFPSWDITWGYYDEHFSENLTGENCSENANPGLWNRCYMVFDIDPSVKNLHLVLYNLFTEDGKPFNNSCKSSWKIPVGAQ